MPGPAHFCLTTRDFSILERIAESGAHRDEAYRRLLRRKLSAANVVFPDDIGPETATIGSRVEFSVDGRFTDNRILIHGDGDGFSGLALAITTLRGLALLGMSEGDATEIETQDGTKQTLRLDRMWSQGRSSNAGAGATVVALGARRQPVRVRQMEPEDDDPGPAAA